MVRNGPLQPRKRPRQSLWSYLRCAQNRRTDGAIALTAKPARLGDSDRTLPWLKGLCAVAAAATLGLTVVVGGRALLRSSHFVVRQVRVSKTRHITAAALRVRSGVELGTNLLELDLDAIARNVQADPWIAEAHVRRELPGVVAIDVVEREPACVLALGSLYLVDRRGEVFKRATPLEAAELPVVTGIPRDHYVDDREGAQSMVREALVALDAWRENRLRPPLGEVHFDLATGVTLYTIKELTAIRIGRADPGVAHTVWRKRLEAYDAAWAAMRAAGEHPKVVMVDQASRPDRVTVRLASR